MESLAKRIKRGLAIRIKNRLLMLKSSLIIPISLKKYLTIKRIVNGNSNFSLLALTEHIGDIVASEPIAHYLTEQKNQKVIWVINKKYSELLQYNPHVHCILEVSSLSEWIYIKWLSSNLSSLSIYDLHIDHKTCPQYRLQIKNKKHADITHENYYNKGSLLNIFCLTGGLPVLNTSPHLYLPLCSELTDINLPEKYIAVQTTSNDEIRCWDIKKWELLLNYYSDYTFIELGVKPTLHSPNCLTKYCGKVSLLEVAEIIKGAQIFIGIDSAFAHFANALAKPSVILLGKFSLFDYYMPYSGNFENPSIATILHHPDIVEKLPVDKVIQAVNDIKSRTQY